MTPLGRHGPGEVLEVRAVARKPFSDSWSREELAWQCLREVAAERAEAIPHAPAAAAIPVGVQPAGPAGPRASQ